MSKQQLDRDSIQERIEDLDALIREANRRIHFVFDAWIRRGLDKLGSLCASEKKRCESLLRLSEIGPPQTTQEFDEYARLKAESEEWTVADFDGLYDEICEKYDLGGPFPRAPVSTKTDEISDEVRRKLEDVRGNPTMSFEEAGHAISKSVSTIRKWCDAGKLEKRSGRVTTKSVKHFLDNPPPN
jgi:hypothetical protein